MQYDSDSRRVIIFDTTLRDGEQSPGATMHLAEKLELARALADLGVDVIEAGFPAASPGDLEEVRQIAQNVSTATICGLARCHQDDIKLAWQALQHAQQPRIHVFLATSPIHREYKLKMTREQVLQRAIEGIAFAKSFTHDIEFSAEDAARTEPDFLAEVIERAIEAGATTINIPDTVGYAVPEQFAQLIQFLKSTVSNINKAILSVHCHNDLGLAVSNSLAALHAGARQVECTINGIGERAGNCALEEIVMALRTRHDVFQLETGIHTQRIYPTSRLLSNITGLHVQRNKAIVGQNAFAHESGIHQHGMLQNTETYEIMKPEDIGLSSTQLILGKHSGRHALKQRTIELGYHLNDEQLQKVFEEFKQLADRKKTIYDGDLEALIEGQIKEHVPETFKIVAVHTSGGTRTLPHAAVQLADAQGVIHQEAACGDGPLDSAFKAIAKIVQLPVHLKNYTVRNVTIGTDSQAEASLEIDVHGITFKARATSPDTIEASACAYLEACNKALAHHSHQQTQTM